MRHHWTSMDFLRTTTVGNSLLACALTMALLTSTLLSATAFAQESGDYSLPEGWQSLPASEFNSMIKASWRGYPKSTKAILRDHAWESFLGNEDFIATGDLAVVNGLVVRFAGADRARRGKKAAALYRNLAKRIAESEEVPDFSDLRGVFKQANGNVDTGKVWEKVYAAGRWHNLPVDDRVEMLKGLRADLVNSRDLSVRWTGFLEAPADGEYEFLFVRNGVQDPKYKLTVGGEAVFNSADYQAAFNDRFLVSKPKLLSAGERVAFVLEMSHSVGADVIRKPWPVAALLWRAEGVAEDFVPASAFSLPAGVPAGAGLLAEYFADSHWQELAGKRVDPSLEFAWWVSPIFPQYAKAFSDVLASCTDDLANRARSGEVGKGERITCLSALVSANMPLSERGKLVQAIIDSDIAVERTRSPDLSRLAGSMCCLPGGEPVDFLDKWSQARGLPRFRPSSGRQGVRSLAAGAARDHWSHYWDIGKSLIGPHWSCCQAIIDEKLELADGQCNLTLLHIVTFAAYEDQARSRLPRVRQLGQLLDEKLKNESLIGDERVSWLIGRAFFEEAGNSHPPAWGTGNNFLLEASLVATSEDYKFWAIQELAARYAALGQTQTLENLIKASESKFNNPEQKKLMQAFRDMVERTKKELAEQKKKQKKVAAAGYIKQLEQRVALARNNGQPAAAERFQKLLNKATAKRDAEEIW